MGCFCGWTPEIPVVAVSSLHRQQHIFEYGKRGDNGIDLIRAADSGASAPRYRPASDIAALEQYLAGVTAQFSGYLIGQGSFTGTIRPDDGVYLTHLDVKTDVIGNQQ